MSSSNNFLQRRSRSTFITAMFSIALVLLFLGIFVTGALYGHHLLKLVQEEFEMMIVLKTGTSPKEVEALKASIGEALFTKEIRYISKDDAAKDFMASVGEEFLDIMDGINPLPASINVQLKSNYANADSVALMNLYFAKFPEIAEVEYPIGLIEQIRKNTGLLTRIAIVVGLIVLLIAFFVINSTIQLAIFSRRLIIRSMQLIGATARFIRAPFIRIGILQGLLGALLADAMLIGLIFAIATFAPEFADIRVLLYQPNFMILLGGMVSFGVLLGWFSSSWAVNRFLHRKLDEIM